MSFAKKALEQKKAAEKLEQKMRLAAVQKAKLSMTAEARLSYMLDELAVLFKDSEVEEVTLEIEADSLGIVSSAIYAGKLAEYDVHLEGTLLTISPKIVAL